MGYPTDDGHARFLGQLLLTLGEDTERPGAQGLVTLLGNGGLDALARSYREPEATSEQCSTRENGRIE